MSDPLSPRTPGEVSRQASRDALLNCAIKELAIPSGLLHYRWPARRQGLPLPSHGIPLSIDWPTGFSLFVLVDRKSSLGSHYYLSALYSRMSANDAWHAPGFEAFADALLNACRYLEGGDGINDELLNQIRQSQSVMHDIVRHVVDSDRPHPLRDYPSSERGLWFGHPNHPTPKARQWPDTLDAQRHAPESGLAGRLHQFEVPRQGLNIQANRMSEDAVLDSAADQSQAAAGDRAVISMHPVQAALFIRDDRVCSLLRDGVLRDLGETGFVATPTASMRTWYIENHPFFIKGSLNVRITNCVRKNAWYELESTLVIDRIMHRLLRRDDPALASLVVAREPATLHWAPPWASAETRRWFCEQTGIILRENFCHGERASQSVLTGTLFARDTRLTPLVTAFIPGQVTGAPSGEEILNWFAAYQRELILPMLALFFRHGIVMEPHLQNCVLIHDHGRPTRMLLRDFEGVKLTDDKGVDWLGGERDLAERVRDSMIYSRRQGWNRIAYCLFINHLSEAILALSWQRPTLADRLWQCVLDELKRVREELSMVAPGIDMTELDGLIAGEALPCKTNFKLRLMARADRQAQYVHLPSPWSREDCRVTYREGHKEARHA